MLVKQDRLTVESFDRSVMAPHTVAGTCSRQSWNRRLAATHRLLRLDQRTGLQRAGSALRSELSCQVGAIPFAAHEAPLQLDDLLLVSRQLPQWTSAHGLRAYVDTACTRKRALSARTDYSLSRAMVECTAEGRITTSKSDNARGHIVSTSRDSCECRRVAQSSIVLLVQGLRHLERQRRCIERWPCKGPPRDRTALR